MDRDGESYIAQTQENLGQIDGVRIEESQEKETRKEDKLKKRRHGKNKRNGSSSD